MKRLLLVAIVVLAMGCSERSNMLVGDWTCSGVTKDGVRGPGKKVPFIGGGFRMPQSEPIRLCERSVDIGTGAAIAAGFAGSQPGGNVRVQIDGQEVIDDEAARRGVVVHAIPDRLAGHRRLTVMIAPSAGGKFVTPGSPGAWRLGSRGAVESAIAREYVPDLALSLVALLAGIILVPGAALLARRARSEAILLAVFAAYGLMLALVKLTDNPLHPLLGIPRLSLMSLRYPLGMLVAWAPLEALRRLSAPPLNRWLAWGGVLFIGGAVARAVWLTSEVIVVTNYISMHGSFVYLALCGFGLLRRRARGDWLALAGVIALVIGLGTRFSLLGTRPGTPDLQLVTTYTVFGLLALAVLARVAARVQQLSNLKALSRYVPTQLVALAAQPSGIDTVMPHARRLVTVFFSDVAGFTSLSDKLDPGLLATVIGKYLTRMADIAEAHGGVIDKFVGDAVMVWFGGLGPSDSKNDAIRCVRMAIAMLRSLAELNEELRAHGLKQPLAIRCGANTGEVTVGDFGSRQRADFTVVGREVNLAARFESTGMIGKLQIGAATYALVHERFACEARGVVQAKGFAQPVETWLVSPEAEHVDDAGATAPPI